MSVQSRKQRGSRTQINVARYLAERGWPYAESTGAGRSGVDVTGCPDLAVEVKARADLAPMAWMRQAEANATASVAPRLALVVYRANGMGEDAGRYLAMVRLADLVDLLRVAGYGDTEPGTGLGQQMSVDVNQD